MTIQKATRNQLGILKNPAQGSAKKVLCVCSAGMLRSPTAANVLHSEYGHNTRAAGSSSAYALIPLSEALILWADEIVFVNEHNKQEALSIAYGICQEVIEEKSVVLDIEDDYDYDSPRLKTLILNQYRKHSEKIAGNEVKPLIKEN